MPQSPVHGAVDSLASNRGRPAAADLGRHLLIGLGLAAGAVAVSAIAARFAAAPTPKITHEVYSDFEETVVVEPRPTPKVFALLWPPLFMALTLSGLRIWNAPRSAERTQALTLWGIVQGLNAVCMALGPRRLGGELATAVASLGTASAYVWRARRVDPLSAGLVAPYVGWMGFANVISEELGRKASPPAPTVH
jgi:tryptophan-rich sensory protein